MEIPGYRIDSLLFQSNRARVYRASKEGTGERVILKLSTEDPPSPRAVAALRRAFSVASQIDSPGVVRHLELLRRGSTWALVMADTGATALDQRLPRGGLDDLERFFHIAIQAGRALADVHAARIIHKDIKPANIVVNEGTGIVQLIDFGIASQLEREEASPEAPRRLEGTLEYMSPEQTGRMNRGVDLRSDLYSFGATLYELLTGQPPFVADNPVEIIHGHIAHKPRPPHLLRGAIPEQLSALVLRLLAKSAEERYASATGVSLDLERIRDEWLATGTCSLFPLGTRDVSPRFRLPGGLYGRSGETAALLDAFEQAAGGERAFLVVVGPSGVGKTSLVHEIRRPIAVKRGYFCGGKFEQFRRDTPYFALTQALRELLEQVLGAPAARIEALRAATRAAVGPLGRVLTDIVPELSHLLGDAPPLAQVGPGEAQLRFHRAFLAFLRVFARPEHPLVLFLDDLQWADGPSLALMEQLAADQDMHHLLLIGGYRDGEVTEAHQLHLTLQRVEASRQTIQRISLPPLSVDAVTQLLGDALSLDPSEVAEAGLIVHEKTAGNPFFALEFLRAVHDRGGLSFDTRRGAWRCDEEKLRALAITDNVVELMTGRLQGLAAASLDLLSTASCLGAEFSLQDLADAAGSPAPEVARGLDEALRLGLLQPTHASYKYATAVEGEDAVELLRSVRYRFQHDRVQQAAYDRLDPGDRAARHLHIGRALLAAMPPEERRTRLIPVVEHLTRGRHLIDDDDERARLARLQFEAGQLASAALAFDVARRAFEVAIELLPDAIWTADHAFALDLHTHLAQALAARNDREGLRRIEQVVADHARSELERVPLHVIHNQHEVAEGRFVEALEHALAAIARFDVHLPRKPRLHHVLTQVAATELAILGKRPGDILAQPPMQDPHARAAIDLMGSAAPAVYFAEQNLLPILGMTMVRLSLRHGNSGWSSYGYAVYALVLAGALGRIERGYEIGQLAVELGTRAGGSDESRVRFLNDTFVRHWKEPPRDITGALLADWAAALDHGDEQTAAYCAGVALYNDFFGGAELTAMRARHQTSITFLERCDQKHVKDGFLAWSQLLELLSTHGPAPTELAGEHFTLQERLPRYEAQNNGVVVALSSIAAGILDLLFGRHDQAHQHLARALRHEESVLSQIVVPGLAFLLAVNALAAALSPRPLASRRSLVASARKQLQRLRGWQRHAPANQRARVLLLEAMLAEVDNDPARALDLHLRALDAAHEDRLFLEEFLACEHGRRCAERQGLNAAADDFSRRGLEASESWGFLRRLDPPATPGLSSTSASTIPEPLRPARSRGQTTRNRPSSSVSVSASSAELDLLSVMKSSQAISGTLVLEELTRSLLRTLLENAAAERGFLMLKGEQEVTFEARAQDEDVTTHRGPADRLEGLAHSVVRYVERTRERVVLEDASRAGRFQADPYLQQARPRSVLCMPIVRQQTLVGVLYLENNLTTHAFTGARCQVLELLSVQAAISLENARLYDTLENRVRERTRQLNESVERMERTQAALDAELHDAAAYVRSLLPAPLTGGKLRADWRYVPSAHLGGDALGYTRLDDGRFAFHVLDVAGHGISSALLSISILSALQGRRLGAVDPGDPAAVLRALNAAFPHEVNGGKHFTMWYGVLDPATGDLRCANGGHPAALLVTPDGSLREVGAVGVMLGVLPDIDFVCEETRLLPGERLFVFSDGVYEILDPRGSMLPLEAFHQRLCHASASDPSPVASMLDFASATRGGPLEDDFTMLSVELVGA